MGNLMRRIIAAMFVISAPALLYAQPANDLCANARVLTPGTTCTPLTGQTLLGANATSGLPGNCGKASSADVWYRFVATAANPTITLSNLGTGNPSITNASVRIQLFSGTCGGTMTSIACVNGTSLITPAASPLTLGATYYVRIYTNSATAPSGSNFGFSICLVNPPANDLCTNATLLTSSATCNGLTNETLLYATASTGTIPGNCGSAASADVYYRFVANSAFPTIILSNLGTGTPSITNAGIRLQLLANGCGGFTNVACVSTTTLQTNITPGGAGLTIGNTYYIRVYTNSATAPSGANFDFDICVVDPPVNDLCADAIPLTSTLTTTYTAGTMNNASYVGGTPTCAGTPRYDVWYRFVAQSVNPTIALSSVGAGFATPRIQVLSGTCTGMTNVGCNTNSYTPTNLVVGNTYFVRVYSTNATIPTNNADFNISITDPAPSNNLCASPVTLTSATTCDPITASMYGSTNDGTGNACGTAHRDVWFRFTANSSNPTVTIDDLGAQFNNPAIQVYSGSNCSSLTSLGCANGTSLTLSGLNTGTTYLVRVYTTHTTMPTSYAGGAFTICVTDPIPANDECSNAILLTSSTTCINTAGTLKNATVGTASATCWNTNAVNVWYRFVAQSEYPTITLSNLGSHLNTAGARLQLYQGTCNSLVSIACSGSALNVLTVVAGSGLTVGNTYYVKITTSNSSAGTAGSNWGFNICIQDPAAPAAPRFGNSYVNLSKRNIGGVVEPGDTLEIRMTMQQSSGILIRPRYLDNVPTNTTMLTTDSIRIITNEGLTYKRYTPAAGDDAATYVANPGPGEYNIRMNFGWGTNLRAAGVPLTNAFSDTSGAAQMHYVNARPTNGGRLLFATSFRVVVTGNPGDVITLGSGRFVYRNSASGADISLNATQYQILISTPLGLCSDATGVNNADEFGGTFGTGNTLNRSTNLSNPVGTYTYVSNVGPSVAIGDGQYGIIKNLSPRSSTNRYARRQPNCGSGAPANQDCNNRMFGGYMFIDGDHTGTNDAIGNPPPAETDNAGYMLMVNADYVSSETYRQTITGLCPNTYYEFSAWIRNVCPLCGQDSTGTQTYTPGVLPNLTFLLDGVDRYSTGQVDTSGWLKKGFVFKTDPGQTTATFSIRNNAQGGGGNDWVMDDIQIATCLPKMSYSPTLNPIICQGVPITIDDTVRSYFDNYTHYIWQRSIDNGSNWATITTPTSIAPQYNGAEYEYITSYTIPGSNTALTDSGDMYRVIVATDVINLGNSYCQVTDGINIINLNVQVCVVLPVEFYSFGGILSNNYGILNWVTLREDEPLQYIIERSNDGVTFRKAGMVRGYQHPNAEKNYYSFKDPEAIFDQAYYRIAMAGQDGRISYSKVIKLSARNRDAFMLHNVVNPFNSSLDFEISTTLNGKIDADLVDIYGKVVRRKSFDVSAGTTRLSLPNTGSLASGVYILRVMNKGELLTKKVLKDRQ